MNAQSLDVHGDFKVTYQLGRTRATLIDDIDEETARKVVARFNDRGDPYMFMPGLRIERDVRTTS